MLPAILAALGGGGGLSSMAGLAGNSSSAGQAEATALQQGMKHAGPYVGSPMREPQQQAPAQHPQQPFNVSGYTDPQAILGQGQHIAQQPQIGGFDFDASFNPQGPQWG